MIDCPSQQQLEAYHDGHLDAAARDRIESHLAECEPCRSFLVHLRAISRLFATAPRARLSHIAAHRLQQNVEAAMQSGVVRWARVLGAVAACIVLGGSLRLMTMKKAPEAAPPWVEVTGAVDADAIGRDGGTPAAQWYLADASHVSSYEDTP